MKKGWTLMCQAFYLSQTFRKNLTHVGIVVALFKHSKKRTTYDERYFNASSFLLNRLKAPMYEILQPVSETKAIRNEFILNCLELKVNVESFFIYLKRFETTPHVLKIDLK